MKSVKVSTFHVLHQDILWEIVPFLGGKTAYNFGISCSAFNKLFRRIVEPRVEHYICLHEVRVVDDLVEPLMEVLEQHPVNAFLTTLVREKPHKKSAMKFLSTKKLKKSKQRLNTTSFLLSCRFGDTSVLVDMIKNCDIDMGHDYEFGLTKSASFGHIEAVKILVEAGKADPTATECVSLALASMNGHFDVVKYLLEHMKKDEKKIHEHGVSGAFAHAVSQGSVDTGRLLMKTGKVKIDGITRFMIEIAAKFGRLNSVKYLVEECGIAPHSPNHKALVFAARNGRLEVVKYIVDAGKSDRSWFYSSFKNLAIDRARSYGHHAVVEFLESVDRNRLSEEKPERKKQ